MNQRTVTVGEAKQFCATGTPFEARDGFRLKGTVQTVQTVQKDNKRQLRRWLAEKHEDSDEAENTFYRRYKNNR